MRAPRYSITPCRRERFVYLGAEQATRLDFGNALGLTLHERADERQHLLGVRARHDSDAIAVADDDVARHDDRAAAADRHVDLARSVLVAATGADGPAEGGKAERR